MSIDANAANQRKKAKQQIVVVLLLFGLLIAILTQPEKSKPDAKNVSDVQITNIKASTAKKKAIEKGDRLRDLAEVVEMPSVAFDDILASDLFAVREQVVEEPEEQEEEPQFQPVRVQAIYGSDEAGGKAALVNNKMVHAGSTLPDGRKVLRVTDTGIELEK